MMRAKVFTKLDERHVKYALAGLFVALAIPAALLIAQAYSQLKWEAFRSNQLLAEDLAARIDAELRAGIATEEARSFGEYAFLVVEGDATANFVQRSPLSAFPIRSAIPGVIGYFQVDADGMLTTPLLPEAGVDAASYGITAEEQRARGNLATAIRGVLAENRLVPRSREEREERAAGDEPHAASAEPRTRRDAAPPAAPASSIAEPAQAAFDRLAATGQSAQRAQVGAVADAVRAEQELDTDAPVENFGLRQTVEAATRTSSTFGERQKRTEQSLVPEPALDALVDADEQAPKAEFRVRTFQSELDPFELGLLDTGHLVMFRNVWRDGRRYVQGALIDRAVFVTSAMETAFRASSLAGLSDLRVTYQGGTLGAVTASAERTYASAELAGSVLHRARLSPPFGDLELLFSVNQLPRAPGSLLLGWVTVVLAVVLCGSFLLMYRFAVAQIRLARQQQDFVSAVSHELKTPLTSIRMYGEMLKAGWADDAKKRVYYDYIHSESERLSRLIDNVLALARLTRSSQRFDMKRVGVAELVDIVRSKASTQVERAGFALEIKNDAPADAEILIDPDCFTQIVINLVDNALKFAAGADRKVVEIASRQETHGGLLFTVRDFGPGVPKSQMKKIFELFYRAESGLTRETVGTGIGLALVRQLASAMNGRVDVRNCEPGAEFRLVFPPAGKG